MRHDELMKVRKNMVVKANELIQNSRYSLSLVETKAIQYMISKIQPNDQPGKRYIFKCREFQDLILWSGTTNYKEIKQMLNKLAGIQWWMDISVDKEALVRWFNIIHMDKGTGDIEFSFHEDMFPYLYNLQIRKEQNGGYYSGYYLENTSLMKHAYSQRIYDLLRSYQFNNQRWTFENGTGSRYDLQRRIAGVDKDTGKPIIPANWSNWAIFKRDVLEPAKKDINKYTDIKIEYAGKKEDIHKRKTRAYRTIEFYMVRKTEMEQQVTSEIIDAEYAVVEELEEFHQMTIAEEFFQQHREKIEEEKRYMESEIVNKVESKYPILAESLGYDFSEEEVDALYHAAIKNRVGGVVRFNLWEMFAVDVVTHYYDFIKATPNDTRTTAYKRLLDMVRKDYENIVPIILSQYQ